MSAPVPGNRPMTSMEWLMLLTLSAVWGGSFFFNGIAVKEVPTFTIVTARVGLAAVVLWLVLGLCRTPLPRDPRVWVAFFVMGFLNNVVPFSLIVWGQGHIASGVAAILNATTPLFTVLVAHLSTPDEKLSRARLAGVLAGLAGVAAMIGGGAVTTLGLDLTAQLACLAAALSYAFAGVFGRRFRVMGVSPMVTATGQVTASSLMLLPAMMMIDHPWALPMPSGAAILALAGIAVLSTAFAYFLYFRILATAGATNLLLVTFLIPVSAIILGVTVLGETLQTRHLLGMLLIGSGLAAIDGRVWRAFRRLAGK